MGTKGYAYDDDDEFDEDDSNVVKQLRKVNRELEKRSKELESELSQIREQSRSRNLADVLAKKGLNPKVAKLIPNDVESSEEAIDQWIAEYGDVFGIQESTESSTQSNVDPSIVASQQRINNVVSSSQSPAGEEDMIARIMAAQDTDELKALFNAQ